MRIDPVSYHEDGDLMVPVSTLGMLRSIFPGVEPTTDVGFYHRHKTLEGTTRAQARRNLEDFLQPMRRIEGFQVLKIRKYAIELAGGRYGYSLLYVIEDLEPVREQANTGPNASLVAFP